MKVGLLLAALVTIAIVAMAGLASERHCVGLADGRLKPCPPRPNCVCSEDPEEPSAIAPLEFSGDAATAQAALVEWLASQPRAELVTVEEGYVHAVFRSRLFRFRDDVELRLDAEAGVFHVRSAARLGHSDLGVNRRRVERMRRERRS